MPRQEPGVRPARPLPYDLDVQEHWADGELTLRFLNRGRAGAVFTVYRDGDDAGPRYYTVEAGKTLSGAWSVTGPDKAYGFTVHGPDGFYRAFRGDPAVASAVEIDLRHDPVRGEMRMTLRNRGEAALEAVVTVVAPTATPPKRGAVPAGGSWAIVHQLSATDDRYDVSVAAPGFERRLARRFAPRRPPLRSPQSATS